MQCPNCQSNRFHKKGLSTVKEGSKQRFLCLDCGSNYYGQFVLEPIQKYNKTYVITSAINDSETNTNFFYTLKTYCEHNNAELLIVPLKYNYTVNSTYDELLEEYFIHTDVILHPELKLLLLNSLITTNPLSAIDNLSKGKSLIIPSPQIMMKPVAKNHVDIPAIMYSTGTISSPDYTNTKTGIKAEFNHSYSALVVEIDEDIDYFHIRVLNSSIDGDFYDLNKYYSGITIKPSNNIPAIVLGDEHVKHRCPIVEQATFTNQDSIVNVLKPKHLIRHDVLDFYSSSHHHNKDQFIQYRKHLDGTDIVETELKETMDYLIKTTPENSISIIVSSNHNDHLTRWLNEFNPRFDNKNKKLYHKLMYLMLDAQERNIDITPLELWYRNNYVDNKIEFLSNSESFKIHDIELALHGDRGLNGSKGSSNHFSKLAYKTISGHQHSCSITNGAYVVGTSSKLKMEYNKGSSSWTNAHCIIQPNGKRQMIFINKGKWRR